MGRGRLRKGDSTRFWMSLLNEVYGVERPAEYIRFEDQVKLDKTSFIDGVIPSAHVLIEQKSINKDISKPIRQSDGSLLSPFQQAKRYSIELPYEDRTRWIVLSDFKEFHIYDMNKPQSEPEIIYLKDLEEDYKDISKGTKGTIVLHYDEKNCEVEFFDKDGDTIDVVMTPLKKLELIESF